MRKRERDIVCSFLFIFSLCGFFSHAFGWDFKNDFSTTSNPLGIGSAVWSYGWSKSAPNPTSAALMPNKDVLTGKWYDSDDAVSWVKSGLMGAGFGVDQDTGSVLNYYSFLTWKWNSPFTGTVDVDIQVTPLTNSDSCYTRVFLNNVAQGSGDTTLSSMGSTFTFTSPPQHFTVHQGDNITLYLGSDKSASTASVKFTVTPVPEPTVLSTILLGLVGMFIKARKKHSNLT